jgi:hypothetical protein
VAVGRQTGSRAVGQIMVVSDRKPSGPDLTAIDTGLRTLQGQNRPLSKSSRRCGCCTIFWSLGKSAPSSTVLSHGQNSNLCQTLKSNHCIFELCAVADSAGSGSGLNSKGMK